MLWLCERQTGHCNLKTRAAQFCERHTEYCNLKTWTTQFCERQTEYCNLKTRTTQFCERQIGHCNLKTRAARFCKRQIGHCNLKTTAAQFLHCLPLRERHKAYSLISKSITDIMLVIVISKIHSHKGSMWGRWGGGALHLFVCRFVIRFDQKQKAIPITTAQCDTLTISLVMSTLRLIPDFTPWRWM